MRKNLFKSDLARCKRKINLFNAELAEYVKKTGNNLVPDVDCTIVGFSAMEPIEVKKLPNGIGYKVDDYWDEIVVMQECGEYWLSGEDELLQALKYNRRRLRKGYCVWRSENPDAELEKEDEE